MKFSLIHPSRSRPKKSAETIAKWISRFQFNNVLGSELEIILSLDADDETIQSYGYHFVSAYMQMINTHIGTHKNVVEAVNQAAEKATGDVLIVVSDDTDCPDHWNRILENAIGDKKDFVLKTWDGIQKRIVTMMVMDREYYNRDKRVFDPDLAHSWSDTLATELAAKRGRLIIRNDIHFPHNHYSVTGEQPDELYKRNDLTHDRDRHIFQAKMKTL